jgi:hypothetical protein
MALAPFYTAGATQHQSPAVGDGDGLASTLAARDVVGSIERTALNWLAGKLSIHLWGYVPLALYDRTAG